MSKNASKYMVELVQVLEVVSCLPTCKKYLQETFARNNLLTISCSFGKGDSGIWVV